MAIWMELTCDSDSYQQSQGRPCFATGVYQDASCLKLWNDPIVDGYCHHTNKSVSDHLRHLKTTAKALGWSQVNGKWLCPPCFSRIGKQ